MADPKLLIEGPLTNGSTTGPDLPLFLTEESTQSAETDTERESVPTQDDEESVMSPLTGRQEVSYSGVADGQRLYNAGYGSDPKAALIRWLFEVESILQPQQGEGYRVTDEMRNLVMEPVSGEEVGVIFDEVQWEHESGVPLNVEWDVDGKLTEGVQEADDRDSYIQEQIDRQQGFTEDRLTGDGVDIPLGEVETRRYIRKIDLDMMDMVHQFDVPNVGVVESGVEGEFEVDGRIAASQVNDLAEVSRIITDEIHGQTVEVEDSLTGRAFRGVVNDSNTTFEAGVPNLLEYRIMLHIGEGILD